jgi:hypothetical protein
VLARIARSYCQLYFAAVPINAEGLGNSVGCLACRDSLSDLLLYSQLGYDLKDTAIFCICL